MGLFLVMGLLYIPLTLFATRQYIQAVDQRLNRKLAEYLVSQKLFIHGAEVNKDALKESFEMLMSINPSIELYLLDPKGNILAYSAPPGRVRAKKISLTPVQTLLSGSGKLPVLGDDPRNPGHLKVFSVSPIPLDGPLEGYLYIILGGEIYDSIAAILKKSYILRLSMWRGVAALIFLFLAGLLIFNLLTRRLRLLAAAMESFKKSDFREPEALSRRFDPRSGDEIDKLGAIFEQMSVRITDQMNEIRRADALRRELVSNVSHDLRTPLSTMHGYLETMLMKSSKMSIQEIRSYLVAALRHSKHLEKLVSELFELAKLEAQETRVHPEPFHPGELVQDIEQKFRQAAEKKKIRLTTYFSKQLPYVFADIHLVERAIQNLVDNAIKNAREGGMVTLHLSTLDSKIKIEVSDNGMGISKEDLPHIFDRFYHGKRSDKRYPEGSGLGLAITKRITDLHGSLLEVASELGKGTTFTFYLPVWKEQTLQ